MQNKFKLNDVVSIKTIVPQFPRHQYSDILSKSLKIIVANGRIVTIDKMIDDGKTIYGVEFNCFDYSQMQLSIEESELEILCV